MVSRRVAIQAHRPKGHRVEFYLIDDPDLTRSTGSGGWSVVDRPRRKSATQWLDYSPLTLTLTLMLDGITAHNLGHGHSVEGDISRVMAWEKPQDGRIEPPVLSVSGPVPHRGKDWVVQSLDWGAAIRHATNGHRLQQALTLTLLEYAPTDITRLKRHPAKKARHRHAASSTGRSSTKRHTVKSNETLQDIAASDLGDFSRWSEIASLNGIRDPRNLTVGQTLVLPS
jgi:hypothetical protein